MSKRLYLLVLSTLLVACSGSTEDVRVTLCKDLVSEITAETVEASWDQEQMKFNGYEDMEVAISFTQSGTSGKISCFYPYDAVEENAMTQSDPASAHATYPSLVKFNNKAINSSELAKMINRVLLKQGKQAVKKGQEVIKTSVEELKIPGTD